MRFSRIYGFLVAIAVVVNWPGRASPDTIDMLYQARNLGELNDWHSPLITFVYGLLAPVFGSPGGALVIQSLTLMTWPALVATNIVNADANIAVRVVVLSIWCGVCAVFVALAGSVVKDVLLVGYLSVLLVGIMHYERQQASGGDRLDGVLVMAGSLAALTQIRPPNLLIVVIALSASVAAAKSGAERFKIARISLGTVAGLTICFMLVANTLFPAKRGRPDSVIYVFDIAGISTHTKIDLFEKLFGDAPMPIKRPWECYSSKQVDPFIWDDCKDYSPLIQSKHKRLRSFWIRQIVSHPWAYLRHRGNYTIGLLTSPSRDNRQIVPEPPLYELASNRFGQTGDVPHQKLGQVQLWNPAIGYAPFGALAYLFFNSILGSPLLWVGVLLLVAWGNVRPRNSTVDPYLLPLAIAGLSNVLLFAVIGPSDDMRYLLPTMFLAIVTAVRILGRYGAHLVKRYDNLRV